MVAHLSFTSTGWRCTKKLGSSCAISALIFATVSSLQTKTAKKPIQIQIKLVITMITLMIMMINTMILMLTIVIMIIPVVIVIK